MNACQPPRRAPRLARHFLFLAVSGLISCSHRTNPIIAVPEQAGAGFLTIQTEKSEYAWAEVSLGTGEGFRATLVNNTDLLFHATLGDRMNAAAEQQTLYVAEGSDGFLERWVPPSEWKNLDRVWLDEGVGIIEIRPHSIYRLMGLVTGPKTSGALRLRVQYFGQPEIQPGQAYQDYSNVFAVR